MLKEHIINARRLEKSQAFWKSEMILRYWITYLGILEFFQYSLETSVPVLILGMLLAYVLMRILALIWRSPRIIREMLANRSAKRTQRLLNDSLILLSKGNMRRAKKKLKSASSTNHPILQSFLLNIEMSIESGDIAESHNWVEKASSKLPEVKCTNSRSS